MAKKTTKKNNNSKMKKSLPPKGPTEWIYEMNADKTMRDLYEALRDGLTHAVEYWEDAGVIEIAFEEAGGIDFEQSEEADVLWVTVSPKAYEAAMDTMKEIEKLCGGSFSVDE